MANGSIDKAYPGIVRCARMSLDVYDAVPDADLDDIYTITDRYDDKTDTYLRVYTNPEAMYIAIRGTDSYRDWITNFNVDKSWWAGLRGHAGFIAIAKRVYQLLPEDIYPARREKTLVFTGHSLGGAVASLLSAKISGSHCITYGQPKVSDGKELRGQLTGRYIRVVHGLDIVPRWPKLGVSHAGTLLYLIDDRVKVNPSWLSMFWDRLTTLAQGRRLRDHYMETYLQNLISSEAT